MYIKQLAPLASQLLAGSLGEFLVRTNKDTTYKLDDFFVSKDVFQIGEVQGQR